MPRLTVSRRGQDGRRAHDVSEAIVALGVISYAVIGLKLVLFRFFFGGGGGEKRGRLIRLLYIISSFALSSHSLRPSFFPLPSFSYLLFISFLNLILLSSSLISSFVFVSCFFPFLSTFSPFPSLNFVWCLFLSFRFLFSNSSPFYLSPFRFPLSFFFVSFHFPLSFLCRLLCSPSIILYLPRFCFAFWLLLPPSFFISTVFPYLLPSFVPFYFYFILFSFSLFFFSTFDSWHEALLVTSTTTTVIE